MSFVFDLAAEDRGEVVHRAALLTELLKPIDPSKMHTNKKITQIEDLECGCIRLQFSDGETVEVDAVVGADGVHEYVRSYVLGENHPALKPKLGGFWDARSLVPMEKAKELLGKECFDEPRQYGFIGEGGFFMHDVLDTERRFSVYC